MTITDARIAKLEAEGTSGSHFLTTTAVLLAIQCAPFAVVTLGDEIGGVIHRRTLGSLTQPQSLQITEMDVIRQINRVYETLLREQVDLDAGARRAIYENLSDLYT
jgi:hypothetical protein